MHLNALRERWRRSQEPTCGDSVRLAASRTSTLKGCSESGNPGVPSEAVEGVEFAESKVYLVDGPDTGAVNAEGRCCMVARHNWARPSGRINEELFFTVNAAGGERIDSPPAMDRAGFRELVTNPGWC